MPDAAAPAFFAVHGPDRPAFPVVFSVPHAGRAYSSALLRRARVAPDVLRGLEDRYVDMLLAPVAAAGFSVLVATAPRALVDLNRAPDDLSPEALQGRVEGLRPSARAHAGLGLLPHRLPTHGLLWKEMPTPAEYLQRLHHVHEPYHRTLAMLLESACASWGTALVIDVHSMPPPKDGVDIAVGDRFGASAPGWLGGALLAEMSAPWVHARRNHPYAGAYLLERQARPGRRVYAVQLEISRALYLDPSGQPDPVRVEHWARKLLGAAHRLTEVLRGAEAQAAE